MTPSQQDNASLTMSNKHTRLFGITLESVQLPLSLSSQQGKDDLDKGNWTDFSVTPNKLCMPLNRLGGGGFTSRRGKNHIGNFGLATNLNLFFWDVSVFCVVSHKKYLFLAGNVYLGLKSSIHPVDRPRLLLL